jgi:hypothetical protein
LCHQPSADQLAFYRQFSSYGYTVKVIVDDPSWPFSKLAGLEILSISDEVSIASGFLGVNPAICKPLPVSAWDKALHVIHHSSQPHSHYWLIEDDVFIPSPESLVSLDRTHLSADLLTASSTLITPEQLGPSSQDGWLWFQHIPNRLLPKPWAHGMVCAVRLSARLATQSAQFVQRHATALEGRNLQRRRIASALYRCHVPWSWLKGFERPSYLFIEYLFHTLALHHQLEICTPDQLSTILWRHDWQPEAMLPTHLYHPVKAIADHPRLREQIARRQP